MVDPPFRVQIQGSYWIQDRGNGEQGTGSKVPPKNFLKPLIFTEQLNGVIFSHSTLNITNIPGTTLHKRTKLFLVVYHCTEIE